MIPPQFDRCESLNVTCAPFPPSLLLGQPACRHPARILAMADVKRPPCSLARGSVGARAFPLFGFGKAAFLKKLSRAAAAAGAAPPKASVLLVVVDAAQITHFD